MASHPAEHAIVNLVSLSHIRAAPPSGHLETFLCCAMTNQASCKMCGFCLLSMCADDQVARVSVLKILLTKCDAVMICRQSAYNICGVLGRLLLS